MVCSADGMSWDELEGVFLFLFFFKLIFANSTVFCRASQEYTFDKMGVPGEGGIFEI